MKKLIVSQLLLLVMASAFLFSCGSKDEDGPVVLLPKADGMYVYGTNTIASEPTDLNARMANAILDPTKAAGVALMDSVYGKFLYIGANSSISFAVVSNEVGTPLGSADAKLDSANKVFEFGTVKDKVVYGTLSANGAAVNVAEEGLYYAYVDMNTATFILMKVRPNYIGDATFPGWVEPGIQMSQKSVSKDSSVFEVVGAELKSGLGYRYRFNHGWALVDNNATAGIVLLGSLGVENYGTSYDLGYNDIGFYSENIVGPREMGVYTVDLVYTASSQSWKERRKRTGNIAADYSSTIVGIEGNAYKYTALDTGAFAGNGLDVYEPKTPAKAGTIYTWTWTNVKLIQGREFIFLQEGKWGAGLQIDAGGVAASGAAWGSDIKNAKVDLGGEFANFAVVNGKNANDEGPTYDISLIIDGSNGNQSATFVRHP